MLKGIAAALVGSRNPESQLFGRAFARGSNRRQLALTYDDGPHERFTPELLEVLAKHDVRATFFMLGHNVARHPKVAASVAGEGHVVGNHSFTHPNLVFVSPNQLTLQIAACHQALQDAVGPHSNLFRPPHGARLPHILRQVRTLNFEPVMWSATAWDWNERTASIIESTVTKQISGGELIMLHDGYHLLAPIDRSATVAATDRLIRRYKEQGLEFVTVPQMLQSTGGH